MNIKKMTLALVTLVAAISSFQTYACSGAHVPGSMCKDTCTKAGDAIGGIGGAIYSGVCMMGATNPNSIS